MQVFVPAMSTAKPQTISKTKLPKPKAKPQSLASTLPQAQAPRGKASQRGKPLPCPYPAPTLPQAQTAQRHTLPQACPMPQRAKPLHSNTKGAKGATAQPYRATAQAQQSNRATRKLETCKAGRATRKAPLQDLSSAPSGEGARRPTHRISSI